MKKPRILWIILGLSILMSSSLASKPASTTSNLIVQKDDPCEEQKEAVDNLIKTIKEQNTPAPGEDKSPLEKVAEKIQESQEWLDEYRCSNRHGTRVREERRRKENNLDKLREDYAKMLALADQLKEEIDKFKKACRKALEDDDSDESLDLKEYNLFSEQQEEAYQEKEDALIKAAADEEFIRIMEDLHKKGQEDCPKYYLRLLRLLKRKVGESEEDYKQRLIDLQRRYPWRKPTDDMREDEKEERERRIKEKWDQDFWEKVKDAIKAKVKELEDKAAEEPQGDPEPPEEDNNLPDDENALPWKDREEYRTIDYRTTLFAGWFINPEEAPFGLDQMDRLLESIYDQPAIYQQLSESLGTEEFTLGTYATAPVFTDATYHDGKQGGLVLTGEFFPQWEMGVQFYYSNILAEAHFPVTTLDFGSTDPSPKTIQGDYTLRNKSTVLRSGGSYRFANGTWQPLLGAWLGVAQQRASITAFVNDTNWQLENELSTTFSYAIEAALRWQSPGKYFTTLHGHWTQTGNNKQYGVALGLGLNFGR